MNIRHHAQNILTVVQVATRSGEWIAPEDSLLKYAVPALEGTLAGFATNATVEYHLGNLTDLVGKAMLSGEWVPGDWASEWQGWCLADYGANHGADNVVPVMPSGRRTGRLAA